MIGSPGNELLALISIIGSKDPHAWKIPALRPEYSPTENVASPFQAEPEQVSNWPLELNAKC
jgi:hypothetical protein